MSAAHRLLLVPTSEQKYVCLLERFELVFMRKLMQSGGEVRSAGERARQPRHNVSEHRTLEYYANFDKQLSCSALHSSGAVIACIGNGLPYLLGYGRSSQDATQAVASSAAVSESIPLYCRRHWTSNVCAFVSESTISSYWVIWLFFRVQRGKRKMYANEMAFDDGVL